MKNKTRLLLTLLLAGLLMTGCGKSATDAVEFSVPAEQSAVEQLTTESESTEPEVIEQEKETEPIITETEEVTPTEPVEEEVVVAETINGNIDTTDIEFIEEALEAETLVKYIGGQLTTSGDILLDLYTAEYVEVEIGAITENTYFKDCDITLTNDIDLQGNVLFLDGMRCNIIGGMIKNGIIVNLGGVNQLFCKVIDCDCYAIDGDLSFGDYNLDFDGETLTTSANDYDIDLNRLFVRSCASFCGYCDIRIDTLIVDTSMYHVSRLYFRNCVTDDVIIGKVLRTDTPVELLYEGKYCLGVNCSGYIPHITFATGIGDCCLCHVHYDGLPVLMILDDGTYITSQGENCLVPNMRLITCPGLTMEKIVGLWINNVLQDNADELFSVVDDELIYLYNA